MSAAVKKSVLAFLSIAPLVAMICAAVLEPWLVRSGVNPDIVSQVSDYVRAGSAGVILLMTVFYGFFTYRSSDPRLHGKKALWISVLFFGNMFVFPVFWYKFIHQ